jgi:hypothetical protein
MDPLLQLIIDQIKEMKNDIEEKMNTGQDKKKNSISDIKMKISTGQAKMEEI